ncbi:DNA-binding protein YbaB [Actinoplanes lutulentus]|uniref:YbaB/EbfC DNA-binding family protein n=1 Tax=Actinoplanes lutulentus TaxID=1287878 RepID=A0A327ZJA5_9ACTN|nr:YbaB/EbfC family nucleoid-associated protein [Actinoplanes lutulentus]MBB2940601.1 DNA-binding protein YbaB [Actinoplanes lutulentus]RAK42912.1 YbaB/EbfC DNA-binding family protein [Actinoplanes lutulentus]
MTAPLHNQLEQAYAEFTKQREALTALSAESDRAETTVTAKNRAVAVTVNGRGAITSIKFPTSAYRTMPAVELASLLVETIEATRSQAADEARSRYSSMLPEGLDTTGTIDGSLDIEAMLRRAARVMNDSRLDDIINNGAGGHRE